MFILDVLRLRSHQASGEILDKQMDMRLWSLRERTEARDRMMWKSWSYRWC